MRTKNPFPGMNPYFERRWRDAHSSLITYLRDALQDRLPPDLIAGAEEEVVTIGGGEQGPSYRPDVQVREPWALKETATMEEEPAAPAVQAAEPVRVFVEDEMERWLEVRDTAGRLITVLELLSPTNKLEADDRDRYLKKRRNFLSGGVNVVEIDLVRQGAWLFPRPVRHVLKQAGACYGAGVIRPVQRGEYQVYPIRLRERLPAIRVPLRAADPEVVLDLQPLIDQCHERGRYHLLDYRLALEPPPGPEDAAWIGQILRENQLL